MARFQIMLVDDDELPEGTDWAAVRGALGEHVLFVKRGRCMCSDRPCPLCAAVLAVAA